MDERLLRILGGAKSFYPHALEEKFPRIFNKILELWDSPEISGYFMELIVPERKFRAGFPPDVAAEIVRLSLVHASSHEVNNKNDVWEVSADKFANYKPPVPIDSESSWRPLPASVAQEIEKIGFPCTARGFHLAVETGDRWATALFLEEGVNTEIANTRGWTPLMLASFHGHDEIIGLLLKHKANVHATDLLGNTALHWAAEAGKTTSAIMLIENHAAIDTANFSGATPLFQAVANRNLGVLLQLIDKGANLNTATLDGVSALHKAAGLGYIEIVRTLLHYGANIRIKDANGNTPLTWAAKNNQQSVIKLITSRSPQNKG